MENSIFTYYKHQVISFAKTSGRFGGFSNMAADYVLFVNEINIPNVEALYQACKFPLYPDIQRQIIEENNPVLSKKISRNYQALIRPDWNQVKVAIMEWCLQLKLLQNWNSFGELLRESGSSIIVEYSDKDNVWGASPIDNERLAGMNILGRLLMKVRAQYVIPNRQPQKILPPNVIGLLLYGNPIGETYAPEYYIDD